MDDDDIKTPAVDLDEPLGDPREMLALLEGQQRQVQVALRGPVIWMYLIWGIAWLVGFLALWSGDANGNPWFTIPAGVVTPVFIVLIISAIVATAIIGMRINRGVRGVSTFSGAVYGLSWSVCGTAFALVGVGLTANGMSTELANLYFPSGAALMCGTIYLGGAALWRDASQLVLGLIILTIGAVAPFAGAPGNDLVFALAGGGAFLIAAAALALRLRRTR